MPNTSFTKAMHKTITPSQRQNKALALAYMDLKRGKTSSHSAMGSTLMYFIWNLEQDGIPYTLRAVPGLGYALTTNPELTAITDKQERAMQAAMEVSKELRALMTGGTNGQQDQQNAAPDVAELAGRTE